MISRTPLQHDHEPALQTWPGSGALPWHHPQPSPAPPSLRRASLSAPPTRPAVTPRLWETRRFKVGQQQQQQQVAAPRSRTLMSDSILPVSVTKYSFLWSFDILSTVNTNMLNVSSSQGICQFRWWFQNTSLVLVLCLLVDGNGVPGFLWLSSTIFRIAYIESFICGVIFILGLWNKMFLLGNFHSCILFAVALTWKKVLLHKESIDCSSESFFGWIDNILLAF